jgi:RNA polymerase sigma-70 factor (ECF subfamily)
MNAAFSDDVVESIPQLQRFARRLAGNRSFADDLVQETVLRALTHAEQFHPGTNLLAWLMTILRNTYFNEKRREKRLGTFDEKVAATLQTANGQQEWSLRMRDLECRFATLPAVQREALVLVGANGLSYDHAAQIAGCAVGTMKSRVSRARLQLQSLLDSGEAVAWNQDRHARDVAHLAA